MSGGQTIIVESGGKKYVGVVPLDTLMIRAVYSQLSGEPPILRATSVESRVTDVQTEPLVERRSYSGAAVGQPWITRKELARMFYEATRYADKAGGEAFGDAPEHVRARVERATEKLWRALCQRLPDVDGVRPAVLRFALAMESKLVARDHMYGHWGTASPEFLFARLAEEFGELGASLGDRGGTVEDEAVDVGNMAMMLFDLALGCAPGDPREKVQS